jgi:L-ascorbate metabolism protein UlaG (beta-lactamase superfamily)
MIRHEPAQGLAARLRLRRNLLLALAGGAAIAAVELGWIGGERPWPEATGWDRLPPSLRVEPSSAPLWGVEAGSAPRLAWLGHAGFVLRWRGATILLDPNLSSWVTVSRRRQPAPLDPAELGAVDAVLISHAHFDHLDLPTIDRLREVGAILVPHGGERYLEGSVHAERVEALELGEIREIGEIEVVAVEADHHGNRLHPLRSRELAVGWIVRSRADAIYIAGDTGPGNDFDAIRERHHPRVAILPIGAWAPAWPIGLYHTSPEQAAGIGERLGVELVVPCHFGTFRLSLDRHTSALPRFARAAVARGLGWRMPALATPSAARAADPEPTT